MNFCPYNPAKICDDGIVKNRIDGYQYDDCRCSAWISPDCISDVCSSRICEKSFKRGNDIYKYLPCELSRCPYTGCGRHEDVIDLPQEVMEAVIVYQVNRDNPEV